MDCINTKCKKSIPDDSKFCPYCGKKQDIQIKKPKSRGNGQGTVYQTPDKKYRAVVTLGYYVDDDGKLHRKIKSKKGFRTKKEALDALPSLKANEAITVIDNKLAKIKDNIKFYELYIIWEAEYKKRISTSTLNCYRSAVKYYESIYYVEFSVLRTDHYNLCVNNCPHGRRTKENMKALATLLYKYAISHDIATINYAENIYINEKKEKSKRDAFTKEEIEKIRGAVGKIPYADYITVMIYTGYRINEFLSLTGDRFDTYNLAFLGGNKTDAGKNKIVTISPKIKDIVFLYYYNFYDGFLFGKNGQKMNDKYFREKCYYPALKEIGVRKLEPHCCRHTFATLMKKINAPATDKKELIGHSKFEMTAEYTHTNYDDLRKITDKI